MHGSNYKVLALLCLLQLGFGFCELTNASNFVWRFMDYGMHSQELPSYKNPAPLAAFTVVKKAGEWSPEMRLLCNRVLLECLSCDDIIWTSSTCSVTPLNGTTSSVVSLSCSKPGFHEVTLLENDTMQEHAIIHIPLESTPYCYIWQATLEDMVLNSRYVELRFQYMILMSLWISEPFGSSSEPGSSKSQALSRQFHSLGEYPSVASISPSTEHDLRTSLEMFNSSCSCWQLYIEMSGLQYALPVEISGRSTTVMDCGIRPSQYVITKRSIGTSEITTDVQVVHSHPSYTQVNIYKDHQVPGVAIILHGENSFVTQDDFRTVQPFQITSLPHVIDEVTFTASTLCILAVGEVFVLNREEEGIAQPSGLPSSDIQHISARTISTATVEMTVDLVVAWTHTGGSIFVSQDGGYNFEEVSHHELPATEYVHSVAMSPSNEHIAITVNAGHSSKAQVLYWDLDSQVWNTESFIFNTNGGNLTMEYFPGFFGDLLLWEQTALYYSPNGGLTADPLIMYTTDGTRLVPASWDGEYITHTATGSGGQFAVQSSKRRLFYGTIQTGYAVEIASGELADSQALLHFDILGQLKAITFNGEAVSVRKVPTYPLVLTALYPPTACPYVQWSHNLQQEVYYLDNGENISFWTSVIPRQWRTNQLSFVTSQPRSVESFIENHYQQTAVEGSIENNMTVLLRPKAGPKLRTAVKFSVLSQNLGCHIPAESVALVAVQCPPSRHIRVKKPDRTCPSYEDLTYTIPKEYYDPELQGRREIKGSVDKELHYHHTSYGCPLQVPYSSSFKPILELYDGDQFLREVDADFVIWELHGRTDFGYTATAEEVGCISSPQTWQAMLQGGAHPSQAWTPENYRHCFQDGHAIFDKATPYPVLNRTGISAISWQGHNGIYVMVTTVVDKNYSYCNLTAVFGVGVYGASSTPLIGYLMLLMTCLIGLAVLIASYFMYRHLVKTGKIEAKM